MNDIITPYMPSKYAISSTSESLDLLSTSEKSGVLASFDVESLFSNVPIDHTSAIILNSVYRHECLPPPKIPEAILKILLTLCTKEALFLTYRWHTVYTKRWSCYGKSSRSDVCRILHEIH